jgi:hypothetical protein
MIKWLIIGLEVPILSLSGLVVGLRISGDSFDLAGLIGMVIGSLLGLIAGTLILYRLALRTYRRDNRKRPLGLPSISKHGPDRGDEEDNT